MLELFRLNSILPKFRVIDAKYNHFNLVFLKKHYDFRNFQNLKYIKQVKVVVLELNLIYSNFPIIVDDILQLFLVHMTNQLRIQ